MKRVTPPTGARCQEASSASHATYIACGALAVFIVQTRDPHAYAMCDACADHNVRNRGALYVNEGDSYKLWAGPDSAAKAQFTLSDIHRLFFQNKDEREAVSKRHAEEMAPFDQKDALLKAWMLKFLNDSKQESATTEHGNCHKLIQTSVTIDKENDGWELLLDWIVLPGIERIAVVMEQGGTPEEAAAAFREGPELGFLNRVVNKTAVLEHIEQKKELPPGVKVGTVLQVGVRRA